MCYDVEPDSALPRALFSSGMATKFDNRPMEVSIDCKLISKISNMGVKAYCSLSTRDLGSKFELRWFCCEDDVTTHKHHEDLIRAASPLLHARGPSGVGVV